MQYTEAPMSRPPEQISKLVSPYGVVASYGRSWEPRGMRGFAMYVATAGSGAPGRGVRHKKWAHGAGRSIDDAERARLVAIAEAAERYAAHDHADANHHWATAAELEGLVMDLGRIPRCSERELAHPDCPVREFDSTERMRWMRGVELVSGEPMWLPSVMANYRLNDVVDAERFTFRISTGHAVHTTGTGALIGGIHEVVERDALTLTWLQRLPLPLIPPGVSSLRLTNLLEAARRHFITPFLFDATTDLEVPTVYCLLVSEHDARTRQLVGCATDGSLIGAAEKALAEALGIRGAIWQDEAPESFSDYTDVADGARYMGAAQHKGAFDFLVDGVHERVAPERPSLPSEPAEHLAELLRRFGERRMQVIAVDRTTKELEEVGLVAVSVVIPDLQPLTLVPLAQFRAHPRLYDAPRAMGYPSHPEQELNPWPQPFA